MNEPIPWTEQQLKGSALIDLGYRDYIAARYLLNNEFIIQGLTLASTAIEKYIKSIILFNLKEKESYSFHFDQIDKLLGLLNKYYFDVTSKFDPVFLSILKYAYKIRYYDRLKERIQFGFYLNQFIGELDHTIDLFENALSPELSLNPITPYKRNIQSKDKNLFENNYILAGQDKKTFMERPTTAFSIFIYMGSSAHREQPCVGKRISPPTYEGKISIFPGV